MPVRLFVTGRIRFAKVPRAVADAARSLNRFDADGIFIATVDAWWQEAGVAAEIDSRAYHLAAADQDRTTGRHDKLTAAGILTLHFPAKRIKTDARHRQRAPVGDRQGHRPAAAPDHGGSAGRVGQPSLTAVPQAA